MASIPTHDVVVVGSGGAALTAAVTAAAAGQDVVVLEKAPLIGGTTAVSGGVVWVPINHHLREVGIDDTREDALAYVRSLAPGRAADPELVEHMVDHGHRMLAHLEAITPLRMLAMARFPDYFSSYDEIPGAKPGGRSCEALPYPVGAALGSWAARLATRTTIHGQTARGMLAEDLGQLPRAPGVLDDRERTDVRTKGAALVGALFHGALDHGVHVHTDAPVHELLVTDGRVVGVRTSLDGVPTEIRARHGVVLAAGGFEWNRDLVHAFIGHDLQPVTPRTNTGDALLMAMQAGALLANMTSYWGTGAMIDPTDLHDGRPYPTFDAARATGGSLIVNTRGQRFVNEAAPYSDFAKAFGAFDVSTSTFPNETAWMIVDHALRSRVEILSMRPDGPTPGWVPTAETIEGLAEQLDIDPVELRATLDEFNTHASSGRDPWFGRPRGMLGAGIRPLAGPFYAVRIYPGTLGTNGGPRLDEHSRVRHVAGGVIPGLYAAGNTAASPLGWAYPGAGATLFVGMTQGYLAGRHLAGLTPDHPEEQR